MVTATPAELNAIVDRVRTWEPASRALLARRILDTIDPRQVNVPPRLLPPERVFDLLRTDGPALTDDEVRRILEEERLSKYA